MNFSLKTAAVAALAVTLVVPYAFAGAPAPAQKRRARKPSVEQQIQQLRDELQSQIDSLKSTLAEKDAELKQAQQKAAAAQAAAARAQSAADSQQRNASENAAAVNSLKSTVSNMKQSDAAVAASLKKTQAEAVKRSELSDMALGKVKIGATFYGDWAYYTDTGFGPQFITQANQPGPGNAGFNSFDVTRTYINFLYTPTPAVTLRFTPNIYRQVDGSSGAIANGNGAQMGGSTNGNLTFRLKYAYLQFNHPYKGSPAFSKGKIRMGQTQNPLVDWEEGLYGYRFVNLTPWNYLSLSSTYVGLETNGPIMSNGKEYVDYQLGVFNSTSFHHIEFSDKKQVMGRLTFYPMGTHVDRTGLGFTIFEDYGYSNKTPDTKATPENRLAVLAHYQSTNKAYEISGEFDLGRNAFSSGNLFSGAHPTSTGDYATFGSMASALLGGDKTQQRGFAIFGHAKLGKSPFTAFGMFHNFQPNTNISGTNPLDFNHTVGGISYKYNKYLTFALDDQNLNYYHSQFTMTPAQIATFSSSLAEENPNGIADAVPNGSNAIMLNA